jgi:LytR cell envelope-related transcriptional attenuator
VLVLAAVIAVVLVLVLPGASSPDKTAVVHRHHADIAPAPAGVVPSSVTVAVVNGTAINQLAHHVADRLTGKNFKEGTLATGVNQSLATTTVGYLPGERNDALAVAHALRLPTSAVRPAAPSSERLVCPDASSCTADVVVVAGSDLAPKH